MKKHVSRRSFLGAYQTIYSRARLDAWRAQNSCPENDRLCTEAIWLLQTMLLGTRKDMEDIADAVRKVQAHAAQLAKTRSEGVRS